MCILLLFCFDLIFSSNVPRKEMIFTDLFCDWILFFASMPGYFLQHSVLINIASQNHNSSTGLLSASRVNAQAAGFLNQLDVQFQSMWHCREIIVFNFTLGKSIVKTGMSQLECQVTIRKQLAKFLSLKKAIKKHHMEIHY